jgi:hypothetical protein
MHYSDNSAENAVRFAAAMRAPLHACRAESCEQGRKDCPCPAACQWPTDDDRARWRPSVLFIAAIWIVVSALVAALVLLPLYLGIAH